MKRAALFLVAIALSLGVVVLACSKKQKEEQAEQTEPEKDYMVVGEYVSLQDTLPHIRYFEDNLVSLNDRCAVRKVKLNPKLPPIYVNGHPVGFC
jgi:hypothetical protein